MFYYFYRFLLSSCVCELLIKFMMMIMMCLFGRLHLVYGIKFPLNSVSLVRSASDEAHRVQWEFYSVDKVQPTE